MLDATTPPAAAEAAPAAPEAKPAAAAAAAPDPVVDVFAADLAETYPVLKELEASGLKYPIEKAWLDEQMKDSKFRSYVHNMRGLATKGREITVSEQKAAVAERAEIVREREAIVAERQQLAAEYVKLNAFIKQLPNAPVVPAGGVPDPKNPDPKVQAWHAQKYVAELFEPLRKHAAEAQQAEATQQAALENDARVAANRDFILRTPDYEAHHPEVLKVLASKEVKTIEAAYHVVKARHLANTPAPAAPAPATTGPDLSKMTAEDVAVYSLDNPEWKRPPDWRAKIRQPVAS
jgi:hypothetical protein